MTITKDAGIFTPLLPELNPNNQDEDSGGGASVSGAVFNVSTSTIGAGIVSIPATLKVLGVIPAIILILVIAILSEVSAEFLIRFTKSSENLKKTTYAGVMGESFGRAGSILLQICIMITNLGCLIIYLIIIGDVLCGSGNNESMHSGMLQEWFGLQWWNTRSFAILFTVIFVATCRLVFMYNKTDTNSGFNLDTGPHDVYGLINPWVLFLVLLAAESLRFTSAVWVLLAVVFVAISTVLAISALWHGKTKTPRLLPVLENKASFFELFTAVPIIVSAFTFHFNVHPIAAELRKTSEMVTAVRISLVLCAAVYAAVGFFGYLLFGDSTMSDILSNFDHNFGSSVGTLLNDTVRLSYALHLMLVFPLPNFSLRVNVDEFLFPEWPFLSSHNIRFVPLTCILLIFVYIAAIAIPNIWFFFQFLGSTTSLCVAFIFPGAIVLRDVQGVATRRDKILAVLMIAIAGKIQSAVKLFDKMIERGVQLNTITCNTIITALSRVGKRGLVDEALQLFSEMIDDSSVIPNVIVYNSLISGLCKNDRLSEALRLFHSMPSRGVSADSYTYNSLIHGLCNSDRLSEAVRVFNIMSSVGVSADSYTYTILINGLSRHGLWKETIRYFDEMMGIGISPNVATFNILIDSLSKQGRMEESSKIFDGMIRSGKEPDVMTYNSMMNGLCLVGKLEEAQRLFDSMADKGLEQDVYSFSVLINGYCKRSRLDEAIQLSKEMQKKGLKPDQVTYNTLIDGLCKTGKVEMAQSMLIEMQSDGVSPDIVTYNTLVNGFCKAGNIEMARQLFSEISNKGLVVNVETYTTMIDGMFKEGMFIEAEKLIIEMKNKGCLPDATTYDTIIRSYLLENDCARALEFLKEMRGRKLTLKDATKSLLFIQLLCVFCRYIHGVTTKRDKILAVLMIAIAGWHHYSGLPHFSVSAKSK
ncbi:hypothetical protein C5167_024951 [Papaver somniferum]|uniref:Amino acid transporter transmembrane domain-containing protein n=1 Tax=Papaver somniferum TaxID=3469 RepID=A0A4Y7JTQ7_PAPSO|nr:hypothetical protein C5167_024951 [Papaver somniferum]